MERDCAFLRLPNEVILQVLCHLTTSDVIIISRVCRRLRALLQERCLWKDVDLRQCRLAPRQLAPLLRHLHSETRRLCLRGRVARGRPPSSPLLTQRALTEISKRCSSLTELRLERCRLNAEQVGTWLLPATLQTLSLSGSDVYNRSGQTSFLHGLGGQCGALSCVDLSWCGWVDSHALLPLSKVEMLDELRLRGCVRFGDEVAYSSIACMFGFRRLRRLDVRLTRVTASDLASFSQLPQLAELLLERPRPAAGQLLRHCGGARLRRLTLRRATLQQDALEEAAARLPQLRWLDLSGCVDADGRPLTESALTCLRRSLPLCQLHYHGGLAPEPEPESESDRDPEPPRKRRRTERRCRSQQCADASADSSECDSDPELPPEERAVVDWANQPGVIVVDLFGGQGVVVRARDSDDEAEPPVDVGAGDENGEVDPPIDVRARDGNAEAGPPVDVRAGDGGAEGAVVRARESDDEAGAPVDARVRHGNAEGAAVIVQENDDVAGDVRVEDGDAGADPVGEPRGTERLRPAQREGCQSPAESEGGLPSPEPQVVVAAPQLSPGVAAGGREASIGGDGGSRRAEVGCGGKCAGGDSA